MHCRKAMQSVSTPPFLLQLLRDLHTGTTSLGPVGTPSFLLQLLRDLHTGTTSLGPVDGRLSVSFITIWGSTRLRAIPSTFVIVCPFCEAFWPLQWRFWGFHWGGTLSSGGHTTNTVALNNRVCNRLYQIIHINYTHKHIHTSKFISYYVMLSLIHIWRCRRSTLCRSRWSPYH